MKADPEYQLSSLERSLLKSILVTDGFKVLQKIMECEVEKFNVALLNANPINRDEVLAAHTLAKAAAQFYAGIVNRINTEMEFDRYAPKPDDKPLDPTEGTIDLGNLEQLPNLLGGEVEFDEYNRN